MFQFGFLHPDLVEYPETESSPIFPGLSLTMKLLLFSLLAFAIILVIFSASVGAICRIQCRVVDTGDQVLELHENQISKEETQWEDIGI